jgi:glycosyltransferase involved in cell wall biosynthesis
VIVCTYTKERSSDVIECIESVRRQTFPAHEIILVLDPDRDLGAFFASRLPRDVLIAFSERAGLSNGRNAGVSEATGDIVAFVDDDAAADKDWLASLVKNYEDPHVLGVGGLVEPVWQNGRPRWFPEELDWIVGCSYKGLPRNRSSVRNPLGCNMSFRRSVFQQIGYFRTDIGRVGRILLGSEEAEFSIRLLANMPESKIIYEPSAITYHRVPMHRKTIKYLAKRSFYEGFSKRLLETHESSEIHALSLEKYYLEYLFTISLPSRLKRLYELNCVLQLVVLLLSVSLVLAGYLVGVLRPVGIAQE